MAEELENAGQMPQEQSEQVQPEQVQSDLPPNRVSIEDAPESRKVISIEVPRERIDAKFNEMFGELHQSVVVPGFRKGHAPRRLLEKRFGKEVATDVRNALLSEALADAIKEHELKIFGEPELDVDKIELPESGPLNLSVTVEVQPEFELPEYRGIAVTRQSVEITPERIEETVQEFLRGRGTVAPVEGEARGGDIVVADVSLRGEQIEEHTHENQELRVAPGAIEGIPLEQLGEKLAGAVAGTSVTMEAQVPQGHPEASWRGASVTVTIAVKEIKRLETPPLTDELAQSLGFDDAESFRDYVRSSLGRRAEIESRQLMREQVARHLLEKTQLEVPPALAARYAVNALRRRYLDLLYRGVPREQIEQNMELLQAQANEQARNELKLEFILEQVAAREGIEVDEGEVNARVAQMAAQSGRRPERLRSELSADGSLAQVHSQIRDEKTMDKLLEMAVATEPAPEAQPEAAPEAQPEQGPEGASK